MNITTENLAYENLVSGEYHVVTRVASGALTKHAVVKKNADKTVSVLSGKQRRGTSGGSSGGSSAGVNENMFGIALADCADGAKGRILYIGKVNLAKLTYHEDYSPDDVRDELRKNMIIAQAWCE